MRIKRVVVVILLLFFAPLVRGLARAGDIPRDQRPCGVQSTVHDVRPLDVVGGMYMPAQGTLRVLLVFASFPDDETPHPYWPAHAPPLFMNQFIDPDTSKNSQGTFNLTNYFGQMSLGQFHLVGNVVWVESTHSQEEYRNGAYGRANTDVLKERVDPLVDFSAYDNWTNSAPFNNANVPDSLVDMIVMVWRTAMFESVGSASLGFPWNAGFVVDGKKIEMGFPAQVDAPRGSGVTCEYVYGDDPGKVMRVMVHEVGHWLLGSPHPYNSDPYLGGKHNYWGMLCDGHRTSSCANAYERERLGWITVPTIAPDVDTPLPDYLQTGAALKYHPPNGDPFEYFYIENHQKASPFDDATVNPEDRGVWILHQKGPYMDEDNLRIRASDGNWEWKNPAVTATCFSQQLPVFTRGVPMVMTGVSHRDQIPSASGLVDWMYVYKENGSDPACGPFFAGHLFRGGFAANSGRIFSPYSNPGSSTWGNLPTTFSLEIVKDAGGVPTVRYNANPLDAAPARRYLGVDPGAQGNQGSGISLAWGAQWADGQPLETDVNWSELERRAGTGGSASLVYQGQATSWKDTSLVYDSSGTVPVFFRARVRDSQGKYSEWSNVFTARATAVTGLGDPPGRSADTPERYSLGANFPNPFNPSTTIEFSLPEASRVWLSIHDLLGREVRRLIDGPCQPGTHAMVWDGADNRGLKVPSGVYLLRMQAGSFISVRKMLLVK